MDEDSMLMCLIAFIIGFLVARMMRGDGLTVGATDCTCNNGIGYTVGQLTDEEIEVTYCANGRQMCKSCNDGYRLGGAGCENKCQCENGTAVNAGLECHNKIESLKVNDQNICNFYNNCNVCSTCKDGYKLNNLSECIPNCKEDEYLNMASGIPLCQPKNPKGPLN
jgi:hypothetical protein